LVIKDLRTFLEELKKQDELVEVSASVDPYLELAEIHRRVIAAGGKALFFSNVKNHSIPVVTNLFGTKKRVELAFGRDGPKLFNQIAKAPHELVPPSIKKLWSKRELLFRGIKTGLKEISHEAPILEQIQSPPKLTSIPMLTTWPKDGGAFITLPLVYTEEPETNIANLGMYRIHRYSDTTTGFHAQIGKGGGFHLARAKELGQNLPVHIAVGGPPVLMLGAIAPLPEKVPELIFSSFMLGEKIRLARHHSTPLPIFADAEMVLSGTINPNEMHPEGPFGDHYGYYSLEHDYPLFRCHTLFSRRNPIYPATVVGKPRQEDFYIGNYLQELLSPLFPLVMPAVKDLWSYGETGYHSLAAAVVSERYKREALVSAFRILGEGQLSLTKFLLLTNSSIDLKDFKTVLVHILERCDFRTDLYIFSNLSMDTLDYAGPKINEGSKGVMLGIGDPIRTLPQEWQSNPPSIISEVKPYCAGCLVVSTVPYSDKTSQIGKLLAQEPAFKDWPLIVIVDDVKRAVANDESFLWNVFTRFEPAGNIFAQSETLERFHPTLNAPIVIDARMKPDYPDEVECDEATKKLVDKRWGEYFVNVGER
jgi:UbiD family decarboxylase